MDPRQYVGWNGQQWVTLEDLSREHSNRITLEEPGLYSIRTEPDFAIGQRAFLLHTSKGNILWDCVALLDTATVDELLRLGGLAGIAISHPHYYTTMVEWSTAFDNAPIFLHEADREWVMRGSGNIEFWSGGRKTIGDGISLIHTPGHFEGFQVLHWQGGAG
jgi:glyoxylase-like metal-dependent hydrolase (beta-lactamase superfamily II)